MVNIYPVRPILYFSLLLTRIAGFSELFIFRVFEALFKELERNMCLPIFLLMSKAAQTRILDITGLQLFRVNLPI